MISPTPKPQLTQSMLSMLSACGVQFQRRFGYRFGVWPQEEIIPPGVAAAVGTSVHKTVEKNLKTKLATGKLASLADLGEVAKDSISGSFAEGLMLTEDEVVNIDKTRGDAIDTAVSLCCLHHSEVAPGIQPEAIEEPFTITMVDFPFDLGGKKDIREVDGTLRDTKTAHATPGKEGARTFQNALYALSEKVRTGSLPPRIQNDFLVKTRVPHYEPRIIIPDDSLIVYVQRRFERAVSIIEAVKEGKEAFAPAHPEDWRCQSRYCGYSATCVFWSGRA